MKVLYSTYTQPGIWQAFQYTPLCTVVLQKRPGMLFIYLYIYIYMHTFKSIHFCPFLFIVSFIMLLYCLNFLHVFLWYYLNNHLFKKLHSLKTPLGAFLGYFGAHFGDAQSSLESCSILSHKSLYRYFFVLLHYFFLYFLTIFFFSIFYFGVFLVHFVVFFSIFMRTACFAMKVCTYILVNIPLV